MKIRFTLLLVCFSTLLFGQNPNKKTMTPEVFDEWYAIDQSAISNNGDWVVYALSKEEGDGSLHVYHTRSGKTIAFPRGEGGTFSEDNQYLIFKIKPVLDTLKAEKRRKVKTPDLSKDSLGIYHLATGKLDKFANVKSFQLPDKWSGFVAYQLEAAKPAKGSKNKKESNANGTALVIQNLAAGKADTIAFVKDYQFAKVGKRLLLNTSGNDSTLLAGIYIYDCTPMALRPLFRQKGDYPQLSFDEKGQQVAFVADLDTTKNQIRPYELYYWKEGPDTARLVASSSSAFLPANWLLSKNAQPLFSKDGSKLYFGIAPPPLLPDTTLLPEEKPVVEVWTYTDPLLYTEQKVQLNREKRRSYLSVWHIASNKMVALGDTETPEVSMGDEGNANVGLSYNEVPYLQRTSWEDGPGYRDIYRINVANGTKTLLKKEVKGSARLSPAAQYAYWYDAVDTAWYAIHQMDKTAIPITNNKTVAFFDELDDHPMLPSPHGVLGWLANDEAILIYDQYDIWKIDPKGKAAPQKLTDGRSKKIRYRYLQLDREERFILPDATLMLLHFNETTKEQGYSTLSLKTGKLNSLFTEKTSLSRRPLKAKDSNDLVFTKEDFQTFPDLLHTNLDFKTVKRVSHANPQQADYAWGTMEMVEWTSLDGQKLQGLLVKPENFDPTKKYPLLVNFYERSSDGLYQHRAPYPHRSTINYSYYANRGYVIFNPDIPYRIGYPGESAYNAVIPGVTYLINQGFIDEARIGVQGHSWGGYQIAYLITKSNIFKCAEAGAPVVNMISAYGGIRWGTGVSRMFQYEQSQSRIGGTLWEYPIRYIENSPIYFADKIQTPVLIMHNDNDSAVPWYQGIEFFVAMRRLGKPAWLLNYNGEPHWPVKRPNRLDFNLRMQQFFDHYLMDQPKPVWMENGVPAIKKGIEEGTELLGEKE
ncbi:MAG: prolyl oligopeptidase family serine peptidase [Saprospiraceae bacterium]